MMNVVKMMGREIMGTQNLAERINEIRAEKNIAIDEIEAAGVSRSQYYRFIRGEASLTAVELWQIEMLFSISFSELMEGVAEKPYQLNIGELAQLPDADLIRERERVMAAGADVKIMDRLFWHREVPHSENFSKPGFQLKTA
ncbi:helix-turn-helix domain-containing protein [Weissella confusa]|uniref:helix-turn-helix domain-containing protein n=3 Tax=Weissella confusa TaxID=1583 RepID=UPI0018F2010F|nr:helix-turn-helix transcriptional regulator [Weissella confusa]MBJ7701302.1 helix-turn-helix transcriptional regulator [Weissella confusa]